METYVALFRGINVGGRHLLSMIDLKDLLVDLGAADVRTYIQSGNVVLRSDRAPAALAADAAAEVARRHGFEPAIWILDEATFREAAARQPFDTSDGKAVHLFFLADEPVEADQDRLASLRAASERFELLGKVFYLHAPDGIGRSRLAANLEACLRTPLTGRNWTTIRKLLAMLHEHG
jgi:uncharacterized protein (DUF1697 family)